MANYSEWMHDLSVDMWFDMEGKGMRIVDTHSGTDFNIGVPLEDQQRILDALKQAGVKFRLLHMHTVIVEDYPDNVELAL